MAEGSGAGAGSGSLTHADTLFHVRRLRMEGATEDDISEELEDVEACGECRRPVIWDGTDWVHLVGPGCGLNPGVVQW